MKYKALICDFDGTLIPNERRGHPSKQVLNALSAASKVLSVGLATGRPLFGVQYILPELPLNAPCIINGGAQIYDPLTKKILKEYPLETNDLEKLRDLLPTEKLPFFLNDGNRDFRIKDKIPQIALSGVIRSATEQQADNILRQNVLVPSIALHKTPSWITGFFDITINHVTATKQHGINTVAKLLKINTHEIISIGDSYNDFPLLMASGLKVAMGNAFDELKSIADYVAPSVYDDGVADVINRFILVKQPYQGS